MLGRLIRRRLAGKIDGWLEQRGLPAEKRNSILDAIGAARPKRRNSNRGQTRPDSSADDWHSDGA